MRGFSFSPSWFLPFAVLLLLPFIYALGFCFPRGDDFDEACRAMFLFDLPGALYEIFREWLTWSGRYTYHFLAVFLGRAAHLRAVAAICGGILFFLYFYPLYLIARQIGLRPAAALLFGLFGLLVILSSWQSLWDFYLFTDMLTICLQGAGTLLFVAWLLRLWKTRDAKEEKRLFHHCLIVGIVAIGIYEYAALAVIISSCAALAASYILRGKSGIYLKLLLCLSLMLAFSFFAPGNFQRQSVRGIAENTGGIFAEWLFGMNSFLQGSWPVYSILCGILLACLERAENSSSTGFESCSLLKNPHPLNISCLAMPAILPCAGAALTLGYALIHSQSEYTLAANLKFSASLSCYLAVALAATVFTVVRILIPLAPQTALNAVSLIIMGILCLCCAASKNFQQTFENAANGQIVLLANFMETRLDFLRKLAASAHAANPLPKFGLAGELARKDARKPAIDPSLPEAVVCQFAGSAFPVWMKEDLRINPNNWPNKWSAWYYGLGAVRAMPVNFAEKDVLQTDSMDLAVPGELKSLGVCRAQKIKTSGKNVTFNTIWLVLEFSGTIPERIEIIRPNPVSSARLLPMMLQKHLLSDFLARKQTSLDWTARLTATKQNFKKQDWLYGKRLALPLYSGLCDEEFPDPVFARMGKGKYYCLKPWL